MSVADGSLTDKTKAVDALLGPISKPYAKPAKGAEPSETSHILDLPHSSRLYKTLVQGGHFDRSTSSIERVSTWSPSVFASAFLEAAGPANIIEMAKGGCTFLIAELVDRITQEGSEEEKKTMRQWFGKAQRKEIEAEGPQGVKVLLEKLTALDASIP
jgi:pumilio family protein 6